MKVIWFNGNFGNQIFYCAYKDYLKEKYPNENIYAYIDAKCPPVKVEERTNLRIPLIKRRVNTLSFIVFKILGALFRRVPVWLVPKWYCEQGDLNDNSIFIGHSLQVKTFYKNNNSKWLEILEPTSPSTEYLKWKLQVVVLCHNVMLRLQSFCQNLKV